MAGHRALLLVTALLLAPAATQAGQTPAALKPLIRSFAAYSRDLDRLDQVWTGPSGAQPAAALPELPPPAAAGLPRQPSAVTINQRLQVTLQQAIDLAVQNDPSLQQQIAAVQEQQGWLRSVRGRLYPVFGLDVGGGYSQKAASNWAWQGNADIPGYGPTSPFYVPTGGWNRYQTNVGAGFAQLRLDYELLSFERSAALAQVRADLEQARQGYGNRLRQLQLEVSEAYYRLQLADQQRRIRQVVLENDTVILDQV
ncbi:MAG: TolC family protein, partial [Cyanobacteriota bacterium]|nr:TolC family protein [Cyanobacteriota bacterium]